MDSVSFSPGPHDPSLLTQQSEHRSELLWQGQDLPDITVRVNFRTYWQTVRSHPLPADVLHAIRSSGLGGVYDIGYVRHDCGLITALVERWRPETHTFHLPFGETTITLEDVCYILRVGTVGDAVIHRFQSSSPRQTAELFGQVLGLVPEAPDITTGGVKISWLVNNFGRCDRLDVESVDYAVQVVYHIRAHLLLIIGSLFPNLSGNRIQLQLIHYVADHTRVGNYSWGSAILGYLYSHLCSASLGRRTNIGGCITLLQIWIWEHFPTLAPRRADDIPFVPPLALRWKCCMSMTTIPHSQSRIIRYELDSLSEDHFIWRPYVYVPMDDRASVSERSLWRAQCPFIFNEIVEWFYPDRVWRQYGIVQDIPTDSPVPDHQQLHAIYNDGCNWQYVHDIYIDLWTNRAAIIDPRTTRAIRDRGTTRRYDDWFRTITRRFILEPQHWSQQPGFQGSQRHDQYYREGMSTAIESIQSSDYTHARDILAERVRNTTSRRYVGAESWRDHIAESSDYHDTIDSPGWDEHTAGMMSHSLHSTSITGWGEWPAPSSPPHEHHLDDYVVGHTPTHGMTTPHTYATPHASTTSPTWDQAYASMLSQRMQSSSMTGWPRSGIHTHDQHFDNHGGGFRNTHGEGFSAFASLSNQWDASTSRTPTGFGHTIADHHHETSDEDAHIDPPAPRRGPPRQARVRGRRCHTGSHII